ncbi:hypothetical protein N7530_007070 [Penicillium desertorum]|uniref:Protein YAE1 n=1 Tax=Penicillium desertorum TaxID=1303715 RepID=A0A9W9WSX2_9EURO|nr:hypothetical protein N7530_007070 [Penicillium desertorum]
MTNTDSSSAPSAPSSPSSPATTMSTQDNPAVDNDNSLDDIFGSSPQSTLNAPVPPTTTTSQSTEPSDLPSLRRQHVTAGYRDGTSASKGAHVQEGFDGGFPVGAQLGMRAGTVLGIMEGLLRGFEERSGPGVVKKPVRGQSAASTGTNSNTEIAELRRQKREQLRVLYEAALKELDVQAVFAGAGGAPEIAPRAEDEEEERAEVQLGRKGDVVIEKWEGRVEVPRWEENMEALEMKEEGKGEGQAVEHS